jgi:NTE family protein
MRAALPAIYKTHRRKGRPQFERIALLLQGGGALGAYQAGVYQALAEADLHPDWIAGISIGALNAAIIAGNPAEKRVEKLREFWETISRPPLGMPSLCGFEIKNEYSHRIVNQLYSIGALVCGAPGFFEPRLPSPLIFPPESIETLSYYDVSALKATLLRLVDFDLINSGETHLSVGAVNVSTGNFVYFDNDCCDLTPAHVMASGSLPPGFAATEIDGEFYWDGGLVSNTPLQWVLDSEPRKDTLAFQIDLWSARGEIPRNLLELETRQKEIRYSSRTRAATDQFKKMQKLRRAAAKLLERIPRDLRQTPEAELLASAADDKVYNIVHLIYRSKRYEGASKDFEFSRKTMEEHWKAGYNDCVRTLRHPEVLERPDDGHDGVMTFDLAQDSRE